MIKLSRRALLIAIAIIALLAAGLYGVMHVVGQRVLYHPSRVVIAPSIEGVSVERIRTEDGETLIAWWRPPPEEGAPVFLYFDGNGGAPEAWDGRWRAIIAGGAGFLAVYYRGYSGSTGTPSEAGLRRDARAGYAWLIDHGYAPRDIVIHGFSLGSAVAVGLAAERPARALILEAPMTGVDDVARESGAGLFAAIMRDSYRSRDFIARVNTPVLIAHGDADAVIPFAHGQALFAAANEPKAFTRIPGGDHTSLTEEGLYDHIFAFLAAYPP